MRNWKKLAVLARKATEKGEWDPAEDYYRQALSEAQHLQQDDPRRANTLEDLALVLSAQRKLDAAQPLLKRCLAERIKYLGPDDTLVAVTLQHLGDTYLLTSDLATAAKCYQHELDILIKRFGSNNRVLPLPYTKLAQALDQMGQKAEAATTLERALQIRERLCGPDNPVLIDNLKALSNIYISMGMPEQSRKFTARAMAITERSFGQRSTTALELHLQSALTALSSQQYKEAEKSARKAVQLSESISGPNNFNTLQAMEYLSRALDYLDRRSEADQLCRRVLTQATDYDRCRLQLPSYLTCRGDACSNQHDIAHALSLYEEGLRISRDISKRLKSTESSRSWSVGGCSSESEIASQAFLAGRIAYCHQSQHNYKKCIESAKLQLALLRSIGKGETSEAALACGQIACAYTMLPSYSDAAPFYDEAFKILKKSPDRQTEINCLGPYESYLLTIGRNEEAAAVRQRLNKLR